MKSANDKRFKAFGGFFAAGLLTFLFLAAVTWFLAGSKAYREAKFNAHQVLTTEVEPGGSVDGDQAVALVAGGSLKQLAEGKNKLVTGGDEDTLAVIVRVSGGPKRFVGDLENWKNSRYRYDKGQALQKAAQAMGAGISARGVKVVLVPDGVMPQNAAWRSAVFDGLGEGGVVPAFSGTTSAKRTLAGTGMRPQDYVIVTDGAGFAAIDYVGEWKFVVTGESTDPIALIKPTPGALVASTPSDDLKDLVSTTASAADKNPQLAAELQKAADEVTSWTSALKLPGAVPAATPKPKPKPKAKPKPKPAPMPQPNAPASPKSSGGTLKPRPSKNDNPGGSTGGSRGQEED